MDNDDLVPIDNQEAKEYLSRFCADWCPSYKVSEEYEDG